MKQLYFLFFFLAAYSAIYTQEADIGDFNLSGDAVITGANCIRLTPDRIWSGGSAWHKQAIDLNFPFEMKLQIMLGCKDDAGADGIVFVFHPNARRTGYQGEGMGFAGLEPSLGIEIDTWLNEHLGDPYQDHIALLRDGSVHHGYNLAGPAPIPNVEDCREHALAVSWSPGSRQLRIKLDNKEVLSYQGDIVGKIFRGNSKVYWGVTAATGAYNNRQEVCFEKLDFTFIEEPKPLELDGIKGKKLLEGEIISLDNLQFESGSANLLPSSKAELARLAEIMRQNPSLKLDIFGHTDNVGSAAPNLQLSQRRAQAVATHLNGLGIPGKRLSAKGFGEQYPIASNGTSTGRLKNRRVEFRLSRPIP
ncbi:MAG: OmpA family protein [Lewinellaceae bacterium]|nr:OmpA family protein [Lewinellaceae bacterium]